MDDLDIIVGGGRYMHLGTTDSEYGSLATNADLLCGRWVYMPHVYPLAEERSMPWPMCSQCERKRASLSARKGADETTT